MKKLTSILAAALALAACQPAADADPAEPYRAALPKSAAVQLGVPDAKASATGATALIGRNSRGALIDTPLYQSEYAVLSYWTAVTVNVGVWWTLELVKFITNHTPTDCGDSSCTWGPWLADDGLNFWRLHVDRTDNGYLWALAQQPANDPASPWYDLISGVAHPGADANHGSGSFTIDFDAQDNLQHAQDWVKEDFGTLEMTYDNTSSLSIQATLTGGRNDDPDKLGNVMNAVYDFNDTGAGGMLQLAFEDVTLTERVWLRTRWNETGAGRGDAHYNDPDAVGGAVDYYASECWSGKYYSWAEVYDTKAEPDFGTEANCPAAFIPASYGDLTLP